MRDHEPNPFCTRGDDIGPYHYILKIPKVFLQFQTKSVIYLIMICHLDATSYMNYFLLILGLYKNFFLSLNVLKTSVKVIINK